MSEVHSLPEPLACDIRSVSGVGALELAAAVGEVLDAAGSLAPDRAGFSERTRPLGSAGLASFLRESVESVIDDLWITFEQRDIGLWGDMVVLEDVLLTSNPSPHHVSFGLPAIRVLGDAEMLEALMLLVAEVFVAVDGFYGSVTTGAMNGRLGTLRNTATNEGRMWIPRFSDPMFLVHDRWVENVWWVNLFGPAYVERWGREVFDRMGVRRKDLDNGGVMVWSAGMPPDPYSADSITGYAHKKSFYEALGTETFVHESLDMPEPGELVPTLFEHRRAAKRSSG